jgi:hypothetical protein
MASAAFTVNGSAPTGAVAVAAESSVALALASTTGLSSVAWSIAGSHSSSASNPTITAAGTPTGATASFTMPAGDSQCYLVKCVVNGGVDLEGNVISEATATALVGVEAPWGYVPFCSGESTERDATHGWVPELNAALEAIWDAI